VRVSQIRARCGARCARHRYILALTGFSTVDDPSTLTILRATTTSTRRLALPSLRKHIANMSVDAAKKNFFAAEHFAVAGAS
jgi:hypothetical protein